MTQAQWLPTGIPPWHLWGNTQRIAAVVQSSAAAVRTASPGQLVKVEYGRPESWHWILSARLLEGPASPLVSTQVEVAFDVIVGVGRAAIIMASIGAIQDKAFEQFFFQWGPLGPFPRQAHLYSTQVLAPNRVLTTDPPFPNQEGFPVPGAFVTGPSLIDTLVAQDIQVSCRVIALAPPAAASIGATVTVEVSAQFAPVSHVRPEWYNDPPTFNGSEAAGH